MEKVLDIQNLHATFSIQKKDYEVLHDISFSVNRNETVCVVGESGCGKSVTTLCIMQLLPNNGKIKSGSIYLDGTDLTKLSKKEVRKFRGKKMGMIFQEPMTALNPLLTIGYQMRENIINHRGVAKKDADKMAIEYLEKVGIANPDKRLKQYPFQLSGGLRQRVLIAMVLSAQPSLLIADEPTTALDVTIQKQVLSLLNDLKKDMNAGILFITHDLGVVAEIADRVVVLYAGRKVEEGTTKQIFKNPQHPYTIGLMNAVPNVDLDEFVIQPIPGTFPNITEHIDGCRFNPRCPRAHECAKCFVSAPQMIEVEPGHFVSCHLHG
ncbi:MAG: ABC transporter ATP-binding protein [Erysipelotrichaceae bacterium]|nr:ABC transporter ATP-binding protein [Erysipelotrichaceae bacterium]MBR3693961.1 ABC transporter ATP-binding protein [Erysipelotrichales bacterium]